MIDQTSKKYPKYITQTFKQVLGFLLFAAVVSSCIPNEKVVYLQNKDQLPELSNDSFIALSRLVYKLQPYDWD